MPDPVITNLPELVPPTGNRRERRQPHGDVPKLAASVEEACEALTISRPTLYNLIAAGKLRTVMLGRRRVIPVTELERLLADND